MVKFSEFYGPERQRELLQEADNQRLIEAALAGRQRRSLRQIWAERRPGGWKLSLRGLRRRVAWRRADRTLSESS